MLPQVPGIIEARMMITPNPDGRLSFSVVIGSGPGADAGRDLIELIILPEHVHRALAGGAGEQDGEAATFPCHVGLSRITR